MLVALGAAAPAQGAVTCGFGAGTATVSMSAAGDSASIAVGTGANAGRIMVGVTACGAATTAVTDTIVVNGTTGAENVTIDLSGGQFAPGVAAEGTGVAEIEFVVDLSTGVLDRVTRDGEHRRGHDHAGASGANLNARRRRGRVAGQRRARNHERERRRRRRLGRAATPSPGPPRFSA